MQHKRVCRFEGTKTRFLSEGLIDARCRLKFHIFGLPGNYKRLFDAVQLKFTSIRKGKKCYLNILCKINTVNVTRQKIPCFIPTFFSTQFCTMMHRRIDVRREKCPQNGSTLIPPLLSFFLIFTDRYQASKKKLYSCAGPYSTVLRANKKKTISPPRS